MENDEMSEPTTLGELVASADEWDLSDVPEALWIRENLRRILYGGHLCDAAEQVKQLREFIMARWFAEHHGCRP